MARFRQVIWVAVLLFGISALTPTSPSSAQPSPPDAAGTVDPPVNIAPADPGADAAPARGQSPYTLAASPTRPREDLCGNRLGTVYFENSPCSDLEAVSGPYITYKTPWEKWLNVMALLMALAFSGLYVALHWLTKDATDDGPARGLILIFVIGSAVFVLTAGYDDKQAAPLYGLLGTLVGYLFGRSTSERRPEPAGGAPAEKKDESAPS